MRRTFHRLWVSSWLLGQLAFSGLLLSSLACVEQGEPEKQQAPAAPVVPPEPQRSALVIKGDATYALMAVGANKCVQFQGQSTGDGARAQIATCAETAAQQFKLQAVTGGYQSIINVKSSLCLEIAGSSHDNGAAVQQSACRATPNQQWIIADAPEGNVRLVARHSGKVIDVQGAVATEFTNLIQWPYSGDPNQRFKLKSVTPATASPDGGASGKDAGAASGAGGKGKDGKGDKKGAGGKKHKEAKEGKEAKDGDKAAAPK
jgi:hypothetical protein